MLRKQQTYEELQESVRRYHTCNIKLNFQNQKLRNAIASLESKISTLQARQDKSKLLLADVRKCNLISITGIVNKECNKWRGCYDCPHFS